VLCSFETTVPSPTNVPSDCTSDAESPAVRQIDNNEVSSSFSASAAVSSTATTSTTDFRPDCWSYEQYMYFTRKNKWLLVRNKKLGCTICKHVNSLTVHKTSGMKLSSKWVEGTVTSIAKKTKTKTVKQMQTALRKKIKIHKESASHNSAASIMKGARVSALPHAVVGQQKELNQTTCRIFRTAYKQIKLNRPFLDFESEIDLQILNGTKMGRILHSNVACGNISRHIGNAMRKTIADVIVDKSAKFAILIDESTTLSKLSTMIVYIRTTFDDSGPVTLFFDLVELKCATAPSIVTALLTCLDSHGLTDEFIRDNCVGLATDGASVMMGKTAGVAKLMTNKYPSIIVWHCLAHRLELGVHDTLKEIAGTNNFKIFIDNLHALYSMSPKNQVELRDCAAQLDVQLLSIGKMLDTRWVASSVRTVRAVWESFPALYKHFDNASHDPLRDARERAKYAGLAKRISSRAFVQNLGLMFDALQELAELSLEVQRRSITIPIAHRAIGRQVIVFEAMCERSGPHLKIVDDVLLQDESSFKGVPLHNGSKCDVLIKKEQFFRSLANNLKARLLTLQSSHVSVRDTQHAESYNDLIGKLKVLYPENWPELPGDCNLLYGTDEVACLAEQFRIEVRPVVRAFREYRDNGGKQVPAGLQLLLTAVHTVPVCTAECERGFSQMNLIVSPTRNQLAVATVSSLLFAKLVGPPLKEFKPNPYVSSWLAMGKHDADDTNSKARDADAVVDGSYKCVWKLL